MCGIIGAQGARQEVLAKGLDTFAYRGPDARGFADGFCALGHARLSIIDLDPRSDQPMLDGSGRYSIVFNGEIYNYRELRDELRREGVEFRTLSDTEVLLKAYVRWGVAMFPRLRGMFAFAISDSLEKRVLLARDHAGIKPLYYTTNGGLAFASELKGVAALLRARGTEPHVDPRALALYRAFGYIPVPQTPLAEIQKLERGSWLLFEADSGKIEKGVWEPQRTLVADMHGLEHLVRESILEHAIADVPVGLFFSGGIDSSVVAMVLQEAGLNLETFSIAVEGRDADEPYFTKIAQELGVKAHAARFGPTEAAAMYDFVFSRMDDPIADSSVLPTAFVSQQAKGRVTVVLSGEGGDELFQGYPRQAAIAAMRDKRALVPGWGDRVRTLPSFLGKRRLLLGLASYARDPVGYYLLTTSLAQDLLDRETWDTARSLLGRTEPLWFDRDWYLENILLRKADMATMYASLEGRVPLLGARLWDAAPRLVSENLAGGTKMVLRNLLSSRLSTELIDRPKSGFGISTRALFEKHAPARDDLSRALIVLAQYGFPKPREAKLLMTRYPAYAFGIVALYRSLQNLEMIE